jgi:hypothetical protein
MRLNHAPRDRDRSIDNSDRVLGRDERLCTGSASTPVHWVKSASIETNSQLLHSPIEWSTHELVVSIVGSPCLNSSYAQLRASLSPTRHRSGSCAPPMPHSHMMSWKVQIHRSRASKERWNASTLMFQSRQRSLRVTFARVLTQFRHSPSRWYHHHHHHQYHLVHS